MSSRSAWLCALGVSLVVLVGCERTENASPGEASSQQTSKDAEGSVSVPEMPKYDVIEIDNGGGVRGRVRISGSAPNLEDWPIEKDQGVCGATAPNLSLLGSGDAVENAVVSLAGITRGEALEPLARVAEIEIVKCQLVPRLLLVPMGSTLEIVNSDPMLHDIQARSGDTLLFDRALPIQHFRIHERVDHPGVLTLSSGAGHTWMSGYVVVQEHPYYARTDPRGAYTIEGAPPGTYKLRVWHELLVGQESSVSIESGVTTTVDFALGLPQ